MNIDAFFEGMNDAEMGRSGKVGACDDYNRGFASWHEVEQIKTHRSEKQDEYSRV